MKDLEARQKDRKERAKRNAERDQPSQAESKTSAAAGNGGGAKKAE
jgi:hypothetical protein